MSRESIIVSGGAGLIGANVVAEFNSLGYDKELVLIDRLGKSPHKWKNLSRLQFRDYIEADDFFQNPQGWYRSFGKVTAIFALGARSHTTETDSSFLVRNNFEANKALSDFALYHSARFVYASSTATYGDGSAGMDDFQTDISRYRPLNPYALSKQLFDQWMLAENRLGRQKRFDDQIWTGGAAGLKYTNVVGFPEFHKEAQQSVILKAYNALKSGEKIKLFKSYRGEFKDGEQTRDFVSVKDAAKVTVWFGLDRKGRKASGLFNVGAGESHSFMYLARQVVRNVRLQESDTDQFIEFVDMPEAIRGRYQYRTKVSIDKLRLAGYEGEMTPLWKVVQDYVGILNREQI